LVFCMRYSTKGEGVTRNTYRTGMNACPLDEISTA